jgi:hypothetical protein
MLTHRTNVLFEHQDYLELTRLSSERGVTMGALVRKAVKKHYNLDKNSSDYRLRLVREMQALRKKIGVSKIPIDYKTLVNEGRKY